MAGSQNTNRDSNPPAIEDEGPAYDIFSLSSFFTVIL